jgi:hypothetical protein
MAAGVGWLPATTLAEEECAVPAQAPAEPDHEVELDPAKQRQIWDGEHVVFKFETYVGKPWVAALKGRQAAGITERLTADFSGRVLDRPATTERTASVVTERPRRATDAGTRPADAAATAKAMLDLSANLARWDRGRFQGLSIERHGEERWTSRVYFSAAGADASGQLVELEAVYRVELRFADPEAIESQPVVAALEVESELVRRAPRRLMENATEAWGLAALDLPDNWKLPPTELRNHRYQIAVADYDRDGWLDVAVGTLEGRPLLLRSIEGRRFEDVAGASGLLPAADSPKQRPFHALAGWIDYDADGWPDLVMGNRLYHNVGGRFEDVTAASGLRFDRAPMGVLVADYDGDGKLDLYVAYQKKFGPPPARTKRPWFGDTLSGGENELWRNLGNGRFENVTERSGAGGGKRQTFAAVNLYFDDDRFPDIYMVNDLARNVLLRNRGDGTFEDATERAGLGHSGTSMGVAAGDIDDDGKPDIYVSNMFSKMGRRIIGGVGPQDYPPGIYEEMRRGCHGSTLHTWDAAAGRYVERSEELGVNAVGWAWGTVLEDLDGDSRLYVFSTAGFVSVRRDEPDG